MDETSDQLSHFPAKDAEIEPRGYSLDVGFHPHIKLDPRAGFEADDDIRAGRLRTFDSMQALIDDLHVDD